MTVRNPDCVQGAFKLLHELVELVILFLSPLLLNELSTCHINGWSGFIIPEKYLSRTCSQTFLTFLCSVEFCGKHQIKFIFLLLINPRAAVQHIRQHLQGAGRGGAEVEEVQRRARRLREEPARGLRVLEPPGVLGLPGRRRPLEGEQQ